MSKISVIIPVYNKESHLRECLDSLTKQTLHDIEILCIDDSSSDASPDILRDYAEKDSRIKIISHSINHGVGAARNTGIDNAHGEFIAFVDADDFVDVDFYERLYLVSDGYDCIKGEIWDYDTGVNNCSINRICNLNGKIKETGNPTYFHHGFTSAIFRKTFIDKFCFRFSEELSYNEDPVFVITLATKLSSVRIVDGARYYYRNVPTSLSRELTPEKIDDFFNSMIYVFDYLKQCDAPYENRCIIAEQFTAMAYGFIAEGRLSDERLRRIRSECTSLLGGRRDSDKVKVSVIVPVYNGEKYLRMSLFYLIIQSLHEIEIICVNDKSTDGSLEILKEYQSEDSRIKIIDCHENGGESKARNIGIENATGEYIAFMDQDDRVDLVFYERLYEKAMETHAEIVKGEAIEYYYDGQILEKQSLMTGSQPLYFNGEWWTAIYRRDFIRKNNVMLPEGYPLGGDLKFLFDACKVCDKLSLVMGVYYHHYMHPGSGDSVETPIHKMKSVLAVFSYFFDEIEKMNLLDKDRECYIFYYCSYIQHAYWRIEKSPELKGKFLCSDFVFRAYDACQCKEEVLTRLRPMNSLLADVLEHNRKKFFEQILEKDVLSEVFYDNGSAEKVPSVACNLVVPYIQRELVDKYIVNNAFLKDENSITYHLIDNRTQNKPISLVYNEFLDNYDYDNKSWMVFIHSDFEFLTFPSNVLSQLDPAVIYGPIGTKVYKDNSKMFLTGKGDVIEKTSDNTFYHFTMYKWNDMCVDTLDCQCLIVHSSLVSKHHLRFDPNTIFDLYVEDFCIQATRNFGIRIEAVYFDCAHHSDFVKVQNSRKRYLDQLKYINQKYPDDIYGGTVSPIGGKILPAMTDREFHMYVIRQEILTGEKL